MIDQIPDSTTDNIAQYNIKPISEYCITETAKRFKLPELVLKAMLQVEASKLGEVKVNSNGSYSVGPMQINSEWFKKFEGYITKEDLMYNGCTNLQVAAWILKFNISQSEQNLWQGVGNYHSTDKNEHDNYRKQVYLAMQSMKSKIT